jgi:uncharacterized protein (TIGR03663 family)
MKTWLAIGFSLAIVVALALRLPSLGSRPLHNDEAVNGIKLAELIDHGTYKYDANEHHGPTLYYASLLQTRLMGLTPSSRLSGADLRIITVVFGIGIILVLPLLLDGLGRRPACWAAIFTAVSPAMVYYSRYYIHEMLLVFFTLLALVSGYRYWRSRRLGWMILCGLSTGAMAATKETFVITLAAAGLALVANWAWNRWLDASALPDRSERWRFSHLLVGVLAALTVAVVLFTSFFSNATGPLDALRAYIPWMSRAGGDSPHIHPWTFYFHRLLWFHPGKGPAWSELVILALAVLGGLAGFARQGLGRTDANLVRFLAFYTAAQTAAYTLISYKTPWCLLNFWQPAIMLAGVGAAVLIRLGRRGPRTWLLRFALLACLLHLGWEAQQLDTAYAADQRNPYVYGHTSPDFANLEDRLQRLLKASPEGNQTLIKVVAPDDDYWPLPWYLRRCGKVGWFNALPPDPYAKIMIVSARLDSRLDEKRTHLMAGIYQLRPQVFFELYVEIDLWKAYLAQNPPPKAAD